MQNRENAGKNKKTVLTIAIALLLVLALALGGFTFARYISQGNGSDSATVAKWGWTISADAGSFFGKKYAGQGLSTVTEGDENLSVKASGDSNVVAPGTTGSFTFSIGGSAEVASKITVALTGKDIVLKATVTTGEPSASETTTYTYSPIKFSLQKDEEAAEEDLTFAELQEKLAALSAEEVAAGETYAGAGEYTVTWEWAFDNASATATKVGNGADLDGNACDTILGLYAASQKATTVTHNDVEYTIDQTPETGTNIELSLELSITVEQIQPATA